MLYNKSLGWSHLKDASRARSLGPSQSILPSSDQSSLPTIAPIHIVFWRPPQAELLRARPGAREVWESNLSSFGDSRGTKPSVFLSQPQSNNKNSLVSPAQEPAPLQTAMVPPDYGFSAPAPGCLPPLLPSSSCPPSQASLALSFSSL